MLLGMLETTTSQYVGVISVSQTQVLSAWWLLVCHLILNNIGLRTCLFPGHSWESQWLPFISDKERQLAWILCSCGGAWASSDSTNLDPFTGGMKYRPSIPRHYLALQIIWLARCFIPKRLPNCSLMCTWRRTNFSIMLWPENNTFFHPTRVQWPWRLAKSSLFFICNLPFRV